MIYWIIICVSMLLMVLTKWSFTISVNQKKRVSGKIVYMILATIGLVMIAGFRSVQVGKDTQMYETLFNYVKEATNIPSIFFSWKMGNVELGYFLLEYVVSRKFDFQIFLILTSIVSIIPVMYVIYKYSKNYWLSIFLFISLGYFPFMMNGIRQSMAIGICFLAFDFSQRKKLWKFLLCIIIAVLFHKSAILFLPVYWLDIIKQKKSLLYIFLGMIVFMFIVRRPLFVFLNTHAREIFNIAETNQGGYGMFALMLFTSFIGWFYYQKFLGKKQTYAEDNWKYLLMVSIAALMWPLGNLNAELNRMTYYYFIYSTLYVPSLLKILKKQEKIILGIIFIAVSAYYLNVYIINGQLQYAPYYFFWQKHL